ncbi:sensor domain-containing diguanylate cyclase [Massilia sp. GCM10023247]|uniref:sensor domain-containing diguanylate cyclase n=1 Tax=Massilia sp. GCM10023247 TaxID=3252643 RepID=UPI0036075EE1
MRRIALAPTLAAVSAAIMLLLTFVTLQFVGVSMAKHVQVDIGRNLAELAFQTTDKLDRGMYERYREVQLMAGRYEITNPDVPVAAKRAVLESMQSTHPYYAWIGLTDIAGKVKIATKGLLEAKDVSARPWFAAAYAGVHVHDVHEAVLLAKLLPNPRKEPKRFFDIAFPYRAPNGTIAGVFGTHLSWQWASEIERSVLRPLAERKGVDTFILSKNGVVLLGPEQYLDQTLAQESFARAAREKNGSVIETWPDGRRYLVGYSQSRGHESYPGLGWVVVVRQPLDEAFAPVDELRNKILWSGLFAAALVSLLVWIFARRITQPLVRITRWAEALRAGDARELPAIHSRLTEVQILHSTLNALLSKLLANEQGLRELNATLETRVAERTTELHDAVEETRKGEHRVKAIIDTALDAFVGVDAQGRITDWNPRAQEIFGWTRDDIVGRTVFETISPLHLRAAHEAGMQRFASGASSDIAGRRLQMSALRRDGEEFPVEMTIGLINAGDTHFFGTFIQDISVRKAIEDELARERELLNAVLDSIDVGVAVCSQAGELTMFNGAAREILALPPGPVPPERWADHYRLFQADGETLMAPEEVPLLRALRGEVVENTELTVKPLGAAPRTIFASGRALHAKDGAGIGAVITMKDVTALKETARRLEASERRLRTITDNLPVLIGYIDQDERYRFANATYEEWFGAAPQQILGKTVREVMGEAFYPQHQQVQQRNLAGETVRFEMPIPMPGGTRTLEITRIPDIHSGVFNGVYVLGTDISAARLHEAELSKLARIDSLTGLPNRRAYQERLDAALQRGQRSGQGIALMYLDVDHFKQVNDSLGHAAGDVVLHEFAQRIKGALRVTDTACRLAGDEFTVILEGVKSAEEAALVARKILHAFEQPFVLEQGERMVSTSIGVAFADRFPLDAAVLGAEADKALYAAKSAGRGRYACATLGGRQGSA